MRKKIFICLLLSFAFVSLLSSICFAREIEGLSIDDVPVVKAINVNGIVGDYSELPSVPKTGSIAFYNPDLNNTGQFVSHINYNTVVPVPVGSKFVDCYDDYGFFVCKYNEDLTIFYGQTETRVSNYQFDDGFKYYLVVRENGDYQYNVDPNFVASRVFIDGTVYNGGSVLTNISFANFISNITGFILDHLGLFLTIVFSIVLIMVGVIVFKRLSRGR